MAIKCVERCLRCSRPAPAATTGSDATSTAMPRARRVGQPAPFLPSRYSGAAFAVVGPAQDGGVSEADDADDQNDGAKDGNLREGCGGHLTAVFDGGHINAIVTHDGGDQNQTGHQADNNGIPEGAGCGDQSLTDRVTGLCSGSDQGSGAPDQIGSEKTGRGQYRNELPTSTTP